MQYLEHREVLVEYFYAFGGELIIRDIHLFDVEVIEEHLLQALIGYVIVDEIEVLEARTKVLGDIE